jgi:polygalacturonase
VLIENCFIGIDDDLVVVKADKGQGSSQNITVKNNILWNPVAHALSIGAEIREPVDNVLFTDCDIIHDQGRYQNHLFRPQASLFASRVSIALHNQFI